MCMNLRFTFYLLCPSILLLFAILVLKVAIYFSMHILVFCISILFASGLFLIINLKK